MIEKIKGWFRYSWTVFVTSVAGVLSLILENIDTIVGAGIKDQLLEAGFDPVSAGRFGLGISIVALIARLRTLKK